MTIDYREIQKGEKERLAKRVAMKRKREETMGCLVEAERHKPGNAAAMREAAVTVYNVLEKLRSFSLDLGDVGRMRKFSHLIYSAKNRLDAALAEPPRNCDVGTEGMSLEGK